MTYKRIHLGPHSGHIPVQGHYFERNDQKKSNQIQSETNSIRCTIHSFHLFPHIWIFTKIPDALTGTRRCSYDGRHRTNWSDPIELAFFFGATNMAAGTFHSFEKKRKISEGFSLEIRTTLKREKKEIK